VDEVFEFAETFKEHPPHSIPPSFNPANVMESTIREIRAMHRLGEVLPLPAPPGSNRRAGSHKVKK
jgi:hypothetical protein